MEFWEFWHVTPLLGNEDSARLNCGGQMASFVKSRARTLSTIAFGTLDECTFRTFSKKVLLRTSWCDEDEYLFILEVTSSTSGFLELDGERCSVRDNVLNRVMMLLAHVRRTPELFCARSKLTCRASPLNIRTLRVLAARPYKRTCVEFFELRTRAALEPSSSFCT